jgi:predicted HD phosphohydrolase
MDIIGNIENNRMYDLLDEISQQSDKLKYGLFSNVRGAYEINPFHKNGVSRKFVGKTTGYSTNASI